MRKKLLSVLLSCLVTVVVFAGKEESYVLHQGFEDGTIPTGWTQEYGTDIQQPWVVESASEASYPKGAFAGSKYVALRNNTSQTQRFVTKLVTPVFNIEETFQPILVFSHAQPQYTGDVDVLRVYYRTSAESRWVKIGEYTNALAKWKTDTISLPAANATYQLAFEGTDNFGRGIALDEIIVRPMPTCDDPNNISTDGLTSNSAMLRWNASLDADSFHVVLSKQEIADLETITDAVKDTFVFDYQYAATELERNTLYYAYIQAYCVGSTSEWASYSFRTKNIATLPYAQTFDMNYASGTISHAAYWSYGTSIKKDDGTMEYMPFINQHISESNLKNYSYSNTTCLVFTGARNVDDAIPAGHYVYAATPELDVEDIKQVKVSFWGTCHKYVGDDYESGLIVGVMTDPADFSTFVPVDTVRLNKAYQYDRFTVYLDAYQGDGKYIGFASNFMDKNNVFYLDDIEFNMASSIKEITELNLTQVRAGSFAVNAKMNGNTQMELIIARDSINTKNGSVFFDPTLLPESYILKKQVISAGQLPCKVEHNIFGRFVQIYARPVGSNNFTLPIKFLAPSKKENDKTLFIGFEDEEGKYSSSQTDNFTSSTSNYTYPYSIITTGQAACSSLVWPSVYTSDPKSGMYSITLGFRQDEYSDNDIRCKQQHGDYIAMPDCENIHEVLMKFYMRCYGTTPNSARVAVGVMSDPYDVTTFDTVTICEVPDQTYKPFVVSFANYKGKGTFPAIMSVPADNKHKYSSTSGSENYITYMLSYPRIDDITLMGLDGCVVPSDIKAVPADTSATLAWTANGMSKWVVRTYDVSLQRTNSTVTEVLSLRDSLVVTSPSIVLKGLAPHTKYYYSVAAVCEDVLTESDNYPFTTNCIAAEAIPYMEDFESWRGGSSMATQEPMCWTLVRQKEVSSSGGVSYYPYVYASATAAYHGNNCFNFGYSFSNTATLPSSAHAALPLFSEDLNKLQMTFYAKPGGSAYVGDTLYVGVMTDPNDAATFDTISVLRLAESAYTEFIVRFENYKGTGKYIAFMKPLAKAKRSIYIDDIKVDFLSDCEKIQAVSPRNTSTTGADIYWQKGNATKWHVLLTTDTLSLGSIVNVDGTKVLALDTVTTMPYRINKCPNPNANYYVYVRAVCSETNLGDWSHPAKFKTTCVPKTAGELGLIDFSNEDELDCWTVGMREGATTSNLPSRNTNKYLYMFNLAATDGAYAVMPLLDIDSITRLQVSFDAHGGTGKDYLRQITVGVISNPADLSTFTAIQTLSLNRVSATSVSTDYGFKEGARYTVRFDGYTGDYNGDYGKQIMFLSESGDKANYVYIRNIKVDTIGTCMEPVLVKAAEVNTNDATIQWEELSGNYQVQLLSADASKVLQDTMVHDTTSVRFSGLEMLTKYSVQVRHICGVGDTSKWSNAISFKTACPVAYPLPYSENFDDYSSGAGNLPDCWEGFTGSTTAYPYVYSTAKKDGKNGLYMYRSTSQYSYAVLPKFEGNTKDLMLSFDYRNSGTSYVCYLAVGVATDVTSAAGIDSTFTLIDSISIPAYKAPNNIWHYYSGMLDSYTGADGYIVIMAPKADKSANGSAAYIDNIYVEKAPTCFRPTNLTFVSATASSVTLTWTPFGKETKWDVAYVPAGGDINGATIVTVDTATVAVAGLTHSTNYDFYVRANCGNGDVSSWTDALTHNTLYLVKLADAHWNFDSLATQVTNPIGGTNKQEVGWMFGNTKNQAAAYMPYSIKNSYHSSKPKTRNSHYALSDSCALKLGDTNKSNNGAYAILPEVNTDLNAVQLRFSGRAIYATGSELTNTDSLYFVTYAKGDYKHAVKIGTLTDPFDISTFELLTDYQFKEVTDEKTIVADGYWEEVVVSLYGAKGKYIAFVSDYNAPNVVYIDDVVVETETGCNAPTRIQTTELIHNKATFTWLSNKAKWNVKITTGNDSLVDQAEVTNKAEWTTTKLTERTDYVFAVQAVASDGTTSKWATYPFTTPCTPAAQEAYVYNFEDDLEPYIGALNLPGCWMGGQMILGGTSTTNMPQAIANTAANQYSRNGDGVTTARALRLYNTSSYADSYVILPETGFELDSVSLHFWARAAYFYPMNYKTASTRGRLSSANNKYQRSIVIGAIADVEDMSTFVALDTFTYSQSWSSVTNIFAHKDETGNNYWEEVIIPLAKYAGKGRIMILYPSNGQTSYFFIDDLEIVEGDFCSSATNLRVTALTAHTADLAWSVVGNDSVHLQVATATNFEPTTMVLDTILEDAGGRYTAKGLLSGQDYYFRVQHFCSAEEIADWTMSDKFVTDYEVRFYEDFSEVRTYPVDWNRASVAPQDILTGKAKLSDKYVDVTGQNWTRAAAGGLIATNDMYVPTAVGTGSTNNYWLVSPIINTTDVAAGTNLSLSFRLGLSNNNNGLPNPPLEDDKFFVAVSEDAGLTWKQENTTWWSDAEADHAAYSYKSIPFSGQMYNVDMTKYIGKRIQIAFVSSSNKTASKNYVRLAQVSLNTVSTTKYAASICRWVDYSDDNFDLDALNLQVGDTCFQRYQQAKKAGAADQHVIMDLTILPDTMTTIPATICAGEDYTSFDFDIKNVTTSQIYKRKLAGANKCDSIVLLDLKVLPRLTENIEKTICQGDFYEFNGMKYYTNTTHADTLKSAVTGCDSIVTLYLTVNAILSGESEEHLCPGETIAFGKFGNISEEGTYVDTVKNALGCDSVATLHVYTHRAESTIMRAAICKGSTYNKYVWSGLTAAGDYPSKQQTIWGCDSIATLHLMVVDADLTLKDSIAVNQLPYMLEDKELLPVGTSEGTYTREVNLSCGTVLLTIVVGEPTGLHSVFASSLAIAPNPVAVGQDIRVLGSFASDAIVEVVSTTGARVFRQENIQSPLIIPGIPMAGVYLVTVTSDGQTYQAKLIVK